MSRDRVPDEDLISESPGKSLSPVRETWDPGIGSAVASEGGKPPETGEPPDPDRVLSSDMTSMGYEMVERGPLAPGASPATTREERRTTRVIDDPDRELVDRWHAGEDAAFEQLASLVLERFGREVAELRQP